MSEDSVSVVIPVYNGARFIADALQSVLAQTRPAQEIIVVDDASEDELDRALEPFLGKILLLRNATRRGGAAARNRGIAATRGKWIAFLDQDDEWLPNKTDKQLGAVAGQAQVGIVYSDMEVFGDICLPSRLQGSAAPRGWIFKDLLVGNPIAPSTALVRREAFLSAGGCDESIAHAQDRDLWLRMAARWQVEFVPEVLARYRLHGGNMSKNRKGSLIDLFRILGKAREYSPEDYRAVLPQVRRCLGEISFEVGRLFLGEEHTGSARTWFLRSAGYGGRRARAIAYLGATLLPAGRRRWLRNFKRALLRNPGRDGD
jgi:glycosyltransferase involved in cell wall biosynthesis